MDKTITIDGKEVKFRATARTPRLYRMIIGRDMIVDMNQLSKAYKKAVDAAGKTEEEIKDAQLSILDLQIFEDVAYIMAKHATPEMPYNNVDDWLDTFDMFSIYEIMPHILELWALNNATTSTAKKK